MKKTDQALFIVEQMAEIAKRIQWIRQMVKTENGNCPVTVEIFALCDDLDKKVLSTGSAIGKKLELGLPANFRVIKPMNIGSSGPPSMHT